MTKIKSFVFIVIFTISVLGLYAEAIELRSIREGYIKADSSLHGKVVHG